MSQTRAEVTLNLIGARAEDGVEINRPDQIPLSDRDTVIAIRIRAMVEAECRLGFLGELRQQM